MRRLLTVIAMALIMVGFLAVGSFAGVKTIKPNELKPYLSTYTYFQTPDQIRSSVATAATFSAEVKLPAGKTLKKLAYYHSGASGSSTASTGVFLYRTKMGEVLEPMAIASSYDRTGEIIEVFAPDIFINKIKSGYTYWIYVTSHDWDSTIKGIKITYK